MNGYLVMLRASWESYPIFLCRTKEEAEIAKDRVLADPLAAYRSLEIDFPESGELYGVSVIYFENGKPVATGWFDFLDSDVIEVRRQTDSRQDSEPDSELGSESEEEI